MILILLFLSLIFYFLLFRGQSSFFSKPRLHNLVLIRDYMILTIIPYLYYTYDHKWKLHKSFSQLNSDLYFYISSIFTFVFIITFLSTYKILEPSIGKTLFKCNYNISLNKYKYFLNAFILISFVYFIIVTLKYDASLVGLLKFNTFEFGYYRSVLSKADGLLKFNKIVIKSWIPMMSYVYLYIYFKSLLRFTFFDKSIILLSIFMGLLSSIWYFEKSTIVFYLLGILGVFVYSGGKINKKITILLLFLPFILVSSMYIIIYQSKIVNSKYLLDIIIHRLTSQCSGSVMAIDYFTKHDYLYFSGISNFLASLNGSNFQSPYGTIIDYYDPLNIEINGAMSSFVTGEAFGLFGVIGVCISGFVVGFYYSFFEATKRSKLFSLVFVGIYGLYFSHFYVASSFYSFLWPVGILYSILPFIFLLLVSLKYKT